jgi:PilZ domain
MRETRLQRRSSVRYKLRLPVIFHWNDGVEHTSGGFTSDLALDGALILSSDCPPLGSEVQVEVLFPSPEKENEEVRIGSSGRVIHLSRCSGVCAFGFHGVFQENQLTHQVLQFRASRQTQLSGKAEMIRTTPSKIEFGGEARNAKLRPGCEQ